MVAHHASRPRPLKAHESAYISKSEKTGQKLTLEIPGWEKFLCKEMIPALE
jgi:hypothetical protein